MGYGEVDERADLIQTASPVTTGSIIFTTHRSQPHDDTQNQGPKIADSASRTATPLLSNTRATAVRVDTSSSRSTYSSKSRSSYVY